MLTALLSTVTSALFGVGDFLGGLASRRESAFIVTANAHAVGLVLFGVTVAVWHPEFAAVDLYAGFAGGIAGGVGVAALYAALAAGRMSVVAPLTAALSGSLPAVYDLARGTEVGPYALVGLALALAATIVVSATSTDEEDGTKAMPPKAIGLSLLAGVAFSGSFISFSFAGLDSGMWPLLAARATSMILLGSIAFARYRRVVVDPVVRPSTVWAGLLDAAANVTMLTAIRIGPLAVASVLGSLYPVATVILARIVLHEHLRWVQRIAIVMALAAVVLSALP